VDEKLKHRLRELFWAACDLRPEERRRFLEESCGGDPELHAEATALLAAHDREGSLLDGCAADAHAAWFCEGEEEGEPDALQPPATAIGPFQILAVLGEGGMGTVYLAEQRSPLQRTVALKVIKRGMDSREIIARFESERQALALMNHPHIARVFDAGTTADGRPYFAMEYVEGLAITRFCDEHRLGTRERLRVFIDVCDAVQHAHQKAIIHRDLKASNVLVSEENGRAVAKVIDFGVAKAIGRSLTGHALVTEHGQLVGTPEYMSPEQAGLGELDIDTRTDVYSLGVLLYEVLVGALPFEPSALRRAGLAEVLRLIREVEPPRPSTRLRALGSEVARVARDRATSADALYRDLRGDLDWIVSKAMEKEPSRRYGTAAELRDDVARFLAAEPVLARPPSSAYRVNKFLRRHRGPAVAGAVAVLALVAGLAVSLWQYFRADAARIDAEEARVAEERRAVEARVALRDRDRALTQKDLALEQREEALRRSEGLRLSAQANAVRSGDPALALLLGIEAARLNPGLVANNALLDVLSAVLPYRVFFGHEDWVVWARFSPNGERVLSASLDGGARLWDVEANAELITLFSGERLSLPALSPDGERAVIVGGRVSAVWDLRTGDRLGELVGHTGPVLAVAFSPDGRRAVTASRDKTARIWDVENARLVKTLRGHAHDVLTAAFSPDGRRVLTGSRDQSIRLWDADSGEALAVLGPHPSLVSRVSFTADGRRALAVGRATSATVWDLDLERAVAKLQGHTGPLTDGAFSPDGTRIATSSADHAARIWDAASGKEIFVLYGHEDVLTDVEFSPDGRWLLTASYDNTARIWDASSGREHSTLRAHTQRVNSASFSPDGRRVVTASWDRSVAVWEITTAAERLVLEHGDRVTSIAFSPDGRRLVTACQDGQSRVWDVGTRELVASLRGHQGAVSTVDFSPDGGRILTASQDRTARVWDASSGKQLLLLEGHDDVVVAAVFSPDGRRIATGSADHDARVWDAASGAELHVLRGHKDSVRAPAFSRDGRWLLTPSADTSAKVWDLESGELLASLQGGERGVRSVTFSIDGRWAITSAGNTVARVFEVASGKESRSLDGHEDRIVSAALCGDGHRLVTASLDRTARVWGLERGETDCVLRGHEDAVLDAAFSPDERWVATASRDGTARLWDASSGKEWCTLRGHGEDVRRVAFSPNGKWLATASDDHTARLWPLDLPSVAERLRPRDFTPSEVDFYEIGSPEERDEYRRRWEERHR
jgi:WD40 repeat protein/serine/threonine protein kinase